MAECPMPHMPVRDYCPACGWRASATKEKAPQKEPTPRLDVGAAMEAQEGQVEGTQIKPDEAPAKEVYFPRDAPTIVGQEDKAPTKKAPTVKRGKKGK